MSYNTEKDEWSINELISYCVQVEERLQKDRFESAHLSLTSHDKRKTKGALNKRKMKNSLATSIGTYEEKLYKVRCMACKER